MLETDILVGLFCLNLEVGKGTLKGVLSLRIGQVPHPTGLQWEPEARVPR